MKTYDVIVLGSGPGGYVAAIKAAQLGAHTAIIEKEELGGVCLQRGCIPTKTLLKNAQVYRDMMNARFYGIEIDDSNHIKINWQNMLKRKDDVVQQLTNGVNTLLKHNQVEIIKGFGEIIDNHTVLVNDETIKTKNLILATGSSPSLPPIEGLKEAYEKGEVLTSRELLEIPEIPKRLAIIGGGVIGIEFATLFSSFGTDVTIIEMANDILINCDKDIRKMYLKGLDSTHVHILTNTEAKKISRNTVEVLRDGKKETIKVDQILISVGRKANFKGLEKLSLEKDRGYIKTNSHLETSLKGVYAIGDLNGKYQLAHVASQEGVIAAENIAGKNTELDYNKVPMCIYVSPEIASVGLTEEEVKKKGFDYVVSKTFLSANGRALAEGQTNGLIKLIADRQYGEILGIHILSPHATDMISEAVMIMNLEGTVYDIVHSIHPHPTFSEIFTEVSNQAISKLKHQ